MGTRETKIARKRQEEKEMFTVMIGIYCRGNKHAKPEGYGKKDLCPECQALMEYSHLRTEKCPFMETKTFCSACKVHCYAKAQQEEVRKVMRYAGPRMLFHRPFAAIKHVFITIHMKHLLKKQAQKKAA